MVVGTVAGVVVLASRMIVLLTRDEVGLAAVVLIEID